MMPRMLPGTGFVVVLLIGLTPGHGLAQEGARNSLHSFNGPDNVYGPECTGNSRPPRGWYPGKILLCDPLERPSLISYATRNCCCWSSPNSMGTGNFHTECNFLWGSSRAFFGEPCLNGPPPPVSPPATGRGYYPPPGCPDCPR